MRSKALQEEEEDHSESEEEEGFGFESDSDSGEDAIESGFDNDKGTDAIRLKDEASMEDNGDFISTNFSTSPNLMKK